MTAVLLTASGALSLLHARQLYVENLPAEEQQGKKGDVLGGRPRKCSGEN